MLFSVFDTETTGLPFHPEAELKKQPRIIEFAGLITDGNEILSTIEFACNPGEGVYLEAIITQITGFTDADLADKPPFSHFIPQLNAHFSACTGRIAHNLSFDKGMLAFDLLRCGKTLDDISWYHDVAANQAAIEICTVEQFYHQNGKRVRLQDWNEKNFGPYVQKHRALDDVILLHNNCKKDGVYDAFLAKESV